MESEVEGKALERRQRTNPWMIILLTAPIPILLIALFSYKWYEQKSDVSQITSQFVERQNAILAHDAMGVSRRISHLFERAAIDVRTLPLMKRSKAGLLKFFLMRTSRITQVDLKSGQAQHKQWPIYNEIVIYNAKGQKTFHLQDGKVTAISGSIDNCNSKTLCDPPFLQGLWNLPPGELRYGKLMRWYSPKSKPEIEKGAHWPVGFRTEAGLFLLGIDYRHLKEILYVPTFPYKSKWRLLDSYQDGDYIYFVDTDKDVIIHPKYWHITGIDKQTGRRMQSVRTDSDFGNFPINFFVYEGDRLRDYYNRLLEISFAQKNIDIFKAPNVGGTFRVVSVAPVLLSEGQYRNTGIMGYAASGCAVDYFEEPKEKFLPYY